MRKILLFFSLFLATSFTFGQSAKSALKLLEAGNFPEAIKAYEKLIEKDPNKAEYHMNIGECYIRMPQKNSYAITSLEKAVSLYTDKSTKGYIDSKFLLGIAYHVNHKFDDAIRTYNELVINQSYKKFREVDILQNEIRACEAAIEEFKTKKNLKVESPGNGINNELTQHSPFLIEDEGIFVYTSKEKTTFNDNKFGDGEYDENVFFILIDNENDKEPDPYSEPLNSKENEASSWVSKDGQVMLLYRDGDIFKSHKEGGKWTKPIPFKEVNSKSDETHASMNDDKTIVYFSSDRSGGIGRKDIYYIKNIGGDKWSSPVILGKEVNTKFDDESPYIHTDGTLYFSSKGHNSIGGYDIFSAKSISDTKFEKAENLGMPINSVEDDLFYFLTNDNKRAFFMSKRAEGKGRGDIFMVNYTDSSQYYQIVSGGAKTLDKASTVTIHSVTDKSRTFMAGTDSYGNYSINMLRGENYFMILEADDHFFEAFTFSCPFNEEYEQDLGIKTLDKINKGDVHKVYSLKFEDDKPNLSNENYLFLDALSDFINSQSDLALNITCNQSTEENLGSARKQNVIEYLKSKGISEDIIKQDILTYNNNEDIFITVIDTDREVALVDTNENTNVEPPAGNYTIQLGAFERKLSNSHRFFKTYKGKVIRRDALDNYNHYTYGEYATEADAEAFLSEIRAKGFKDAFVREISWYK